ncbi:hypothetical protein L1987_25289 [Smallanthus sonchifolius]|uniref:Uncharacterized protein n=1 Tax=Smallanthus sonchifolius TaxID=185202 RepID=A0ACB9IM61_9ASTR|nr:hypothetical protein L1987_25289 [Smallanthus sonchifolius]
MNRFVYTEASVASLENSYPPTDHHSLPFNENDSEEMLLFRVICGAQPARHIKEECLESAKECSYRGVRRLAVLNFSAEIAYESLKKMDYKYEEGSSPILALKRKHAVKRKSMKKKVKVENVVVLEDLGGDYLEELLTCSWSTT